jgi:nicotinamide riboside kinase
MIIALLGAESTGKTQLTHQLVAHFCARGQSALAVDEYLRQWCDAQQRTPQREEQWLIAQEQQRRIEAAHRRASIVLADTTPLMTAVYSDFCFQDTRLYESAVQFQRKCDVTLVTGLDIAWQADGLQRDGPQVREPVDTLVRSALQGSGIAYSMVYGMGDARLHNALDAIHSIAAYARISLAKDIKQSNPWVWVCDKCSDPDCEHRLFSGLGKAP